ncbi:MAG: UDP-N-acetylmuramate--L-alanine ligase [Anaerolineales bacterium]|nr:UDP-N-acetylmuramate--L-alanine ligase [Anaerolineales bacterium]
MTRVHFIGIGGSGLSAIARLLKESGCDVTGSDNALSPFAAELQRIGIQVFIGHHPRNVQGADMVIRSSAVGDDNPEAQAALQAGIPLYKRADFLGRLMENKTGVAVAGSHGKTTVAAMIAWMLTSLKRDPSFIVGSVLSNLGVNAHAGKGAPFVIEADEYDRMFLGLKPRIEVVTNLEHDHPDCFPTFDDIRSAFESFIDLLPQNGVFIASSENQGSAALMTYARRKKLNVVSYAIENDLTINCPQWMQARDLRPNRKGGFDFTVASNLDGMLKAFGVSLQVPGQHNVRNALAALCVASALKLPMKEAAAALNQFTGTSRRFELKGEAKRVLFVDDYAHHPTEIRATLAGARARYPERRIWALWQPHTYSRTQTLQAEFARAFDDADEVLVTEIYASREAPQNFSAKEVVAAMTHPSARYGGSLDETKKYLRDHLRPNDALIVLSAGDANRLIDELMKEL